MSPAPGEREASAGSDGDIDRLRDALDELTRMNNELVNRDRELTRKTLELEQLNRRKNELLGMAAHDLRNPMSALHGLAEVLRDRYGDRLDEQGRVVVGRILRSSGHMLQLIDDLLNVSQIEAGALRLDPEDVDLAMLVQQTIEVHAAQAEDKDISITASGVDDPVPVKVDPSKIEQVLMNLLSNAIKYSHRGTTIEIAVTVDPDEVAVAVRDEGQGIPPEEQSQLFRPFGRTSVRGTEGERSTGLGLAIAWSIVHGHGGRIEVDSKPGVGSVFTVTLPRRPA